MWLETYGELGNDISDVEFSSDLPVRLILIVQAIVGWRGAGSRPRRIVYSTTLRYSQY